MTAQQSRHTLDGPVTTIRRGVAIYKKHSSPFWYARIWDARNKRNVVRSTKEKSKIAARQFAEDLYIELLGGKAQPPKQYTFKHYAQRLIAISRTMVELGQRNANYVNTIVTFLENKEWGLQKQFQHRDVRELRTKDYADFLDKLAKDRPDLSDSTRNMMTATFRNVLKVAVRDGVIDSVPATPRDRQRDNPRAYLPFYPLVGRKQCAYTKVRNAVRTLTKEHRDFIKKAEKLNKPKTIYDEKKLRIVPITSELGDLIVFAVNTFVRPTTTELYALKHEDITIADNPRSLLVTIKKGKTGYRRSYSMENAVDVYERIRQRNPNAKPNDYLFFPSYSNRSTVRDIVHRQFGLVLRKAGVQNDPVAGLKYSVYSLRHTAICMRIILGGGKVDIYTLAKNAGTSVEQIERFYAKHLPISAELARNLHHFERELKKELEKDAENDGEAETEGDEVEGDDDLEFFRKLAEMD
jgi:hypothetical protein